jgi:hypothetical protein
LCSGPGFGIWGGACATIKHARQRKKVAVREIFLIIVADSF